MGVAPSPVLRLGLLSTANITIRLVAGAAASDRVEAVAVGGRERERAEAFAAAHGIPRAHGSYEALLADPEVDAVYVALPNALHAEWALRAVRAAKHVLVEKPLSTDPAQAQALFDAADEAGVVVMEAFMWRHHPQVARLQALLAEGVVGDLREVRAAFSFTLDREHDVRWDPSLGGGSLLDVGTYCVNAGRLLAGEPERAVGVAVRGRGGVDVRFAGAMSHPGGVLTVFDCGFDLPYRASVEAIGALGSLVLADPFHAARPVVEIHSDGGVEVEELEAVDAYRLELESLAAAVRGDAPALLGRADAVGQARALRMLQESAA